MKLVKAQCTNCNANLKVDNLKEKAICPYCNTEYIVEEAINNYTINANNITIQNANIITSSPKKVDIFEIDDDILIRYNGEDEKVIIPKEVLKIKQGAFSGNPKLKMVVIHEYVELIECAAFYTCKFLESVIIQGEDLKIESSAFYECKRLEKVTFEKGKVKCDPTAFYKCKYILPEELGGYQNGNDEVVLYKVETGCYDYDDNWIKGSCNSASGVDLKVELKNNYNESIKYIDFDVTPKNAVGDDVESIYETQMIGCRITGPITPQETNEFYWENKWYNSTIVDAKITELRIEYMNGKLIKISEDNIVYETKKKNVRILKKDGEPELLEEPHELGSCYVATCVYGSYNCPQVWTLRRYRDDSLAKTWYGRTFIKVYYAISPTIVKIFGKTKWFKEFWKSRLDKMVVKLQARGFENTPYDDRKW